jgi:hypothetical protein
MRPEEKRSRIGVWLVLALAVLAPIAGCAKDPVGGTVRVSGKITYHGGNWPTSGFIGFAPLEKAEGFKLLPGLSRFDTEGNFDVWCGDHQGLVPGEYRAVVRCAAATGEGGERVEGDMGKSLVPDKYANAPDSPLKLTVEKGSGPIVLKWDIPNE